MQKRSTSSLGPVGGIAVENPLRATIYARRGLMKFSVPFEITIVPLGNGIPYPEVPAPNGYLNSGQVKPQHDVSQSPYNRNTYRQYPNSQFGQSYYPSSSYPYSNPSYPYGYNNYNSYNGYNHQYRNPYYGVPARRVDISHTKPWPQYRPSQQVGK